jgi:hypothetical protein
MSNLIFLDDYRPSSLSIGVDNYNKSSSIEINLLGRRLERDFCDIIKEKNIFFFVENNKKYLIKDQLILEILSKQTPFMQAFEDDYFDSSITSYRFQRVSELNLHNYLEFLSAVMQEISHLQQAHKSELANLSYCGYVTKIKKIKNREIFQINDFFNPGIFFQFEKKKTEKDLTLSYLSFELLLATTFLEQFLYCGKNLQIENNGKF